jgi:Tripartite tricarboxylate transporter TctB family
MRIRAPKDFWSGVMFCGFAAVAIFSARGYALGTAGKMGPGYFPLLLAVLLAALGATLIARSVVLTGEPVSRFHVLPLAVIAAAVCLFGVLIEPLGLVVSLAALTLMRPGQARSFAWRKRSHWRPRSSSSRSGFLSMRSASHSISGRPSSLRWT